MARVKPGDVLYDLGCGDGRIVIAAAKRFGIRGVGIDIDSQRIAEAQENARKAGVADRCKFIQGDLFDADIKEATVVTLYLLPEVNLRLRPKLAERPQAGHPDRLAQLRHGRLETRADGEAHRGRHGARRLPVDDGEREPAPGGALTGGPAGAAVARR